MPSTREWSGYLSVEQDSSNHELGQHHQIIFYDIYL
jgi:hypothetical protein